MMERNWPQLVALNWFFLWPGDGLKGKVQRIAGCLVSVSCPCLFVAEAFEVRQAILRWDFVSTMQPLNEAISGTLFYFSSLNIIFFRRQIQETLNLIDDLNERIIYDVGGLALDEIKSRKAFGRKVYKAFICTFFFLVTPWTVGPIVKIIFYQERTLIVHSWVPFGNDYFLTYIGQFVFQAMCAYTYCMAQVMFASLYVSICELIFGHLKILSQRLENIKYGMPTTSTEIIKCIQHQEHIFRIIDMFQRVTELPLITDCVFTMLLLCVILVDLMNAEKGSEGRVISVIAEAQTVLFFLGMFCWYGNEITVKCAEILYPCYFSDWYNGTNLEKKLLHNIMTRTMRPVYFGGIVKIDSLTFLNILKGAFSYYNVLTAESKLSSK